MFAQTSINDHAIESKYTLTSYDNELVFCHGCCSDVPSEENGVGWKQQLDDSLTGDSGVGCKGWC